MRLRVTAAAQADAEFMEIVGKAESLPPRLLDELCADVKACGHPEADVEPFVQLMVLKTYCRDFHALLLSPTPEVDAVWHVAMLNPQLYVAFCDHIASGRLIGHKLNPTSPPASRREAASKLHAKLFCPADEETEPSQAGGSRKRKAADNVEREGGSIELNVKTLRGMSFSVVMEAEATVADLHAAIQEKEGTPVQLQRLTCMGRELPNQMPAAQSIKLASIGLIYDGCDIHLVLKLRGC